MKMLQKFLFQNTIDPFRRATALGFAGCILTLMLSACSLPNLSADTSYTATGLYFDTVIQIKVFDADDKEAADACLALCDTYENLLSRTISDSEISQINNADGTLVTISEETAQILLLGQSYGELSGGIFDITIGRLTSLWNFGENEGTVPSEDAIKEALATVNYQNLSVECDENGTWTATLQNKDAMLDLGGIAKGAIADLLKDYLLSEGVEGAVINLGGNVLTVGEKPDRSDFSVAVVKPFGDGEYLFALTIKDGSVVTSGNYERFFIKDDILYHHILDTSTGYPVQNDLYAVTILCASSAMGDALSTTCYALGLDDGMALIESMEGV